MKLKLIICLLLVAILIPNIAVCANSSELTETQFRIKPLQDNLKSMSSTQISNCVDKFSDMKIHWSKTVVGKLTNLGIIAGYSGKFWPNDPVQVDQFIKMSIMAMGYKIEQGEDYWAQPYIDKAIEEGIVENGEFKDYKNNLTREQMAKIIVRAILKIEENPNNEYDKYIIGKIGDYESISDNLKQFIIDGYKIGLIQGSNGKFNPKNTLTRAEAAAVIIRILDVTERKPMTPGKDEILNMIDSRGNPTVVYPGGVRELFTVAKATEKATETYKGKGFINFFIGDDGKYIAAQMYKDEKSYKNSIFDMVASFKIAYNVKDEIYGYTLNVWQDELYEKLFPDFTREILKTIFEEDSQNAIKLHDKYMTQEYTRKDGLNDYTTTKLNNRTVSFLRYNEDSFAVKVKLKGIK